MAMGKRTGKQQPLWVSFQDLKAPGHPFYREVNRLLHEAHFDEEVEMMCAPYYKEKGRPSIAPGVYFRMLLIGYFEDIDSQRGIAWRCADSLSLKEFLGLSMDEPTPDHSSLTRVRKRLPLEVHEDVFRLVLGIGIDKELLRAKTVAVDSTYIEANAAMKSIVRKDTKETYAQYARRLAEQEGGLENPSDEEVRRFDRHRPDKKVSNSDWQSSSDPESRIVRMKDGRTHMGYKAEHAVDLDCDLLVAAEIYAGDEGDARTLLETIERTHRHLNTTGRRKRLELTEVVADKGYNSTQNLKELRDRGTRTYIPEADRSHNRRWKADSEQDRSAVYENRRRVRRPKGRSLQRRRSEMTERSFAHVCDTGGARRSWLRGLIDVAKYHFLRCAARNLGVILRTIVGIGTPKALQDARNRAALVLRALIDSMLDFLGRIEVVLNMHRVLRARIA